MTPSRKTRRASHSRFFHAPRDVALLVIGAAFLGSFVIAGMNIPSIYHTARAQVEAQKTDTGNQKNYVESLRETHRNWERDLKNMSRTLKGAYLTTAQNLLTDLGAAIDQLANSIGAEDFWNATSDVNALQQDMSLELQNLYALQSYENLANEIKSAERGTKDMERLLKDTKRNLKGESADLGELQNYIDGYKDALGKIKTQYAAIDKTSEDLQSAIQDVQYALKDLSGDYSQPFYEEMGEKQEQANRVTQQKDAKRSAKKMQGMIKDLERKTKRFTRRKLDITELVAAIGELKSIVSQMHDTANAPPSDFDPDAFWDLQADASELQTSAWETMTAIENYLNQGRWLKSTARELKNIERSVSDVRRQAASGGDAAAVLPELEELLAQMRDVFKQASEAYRTKNYDEAEGLLKELSDLQQDFYDTQSSLSYETQEVQVVPQREEIGKLASAIEAAFQKLASAEKTGTISSETAGTCRSTFGVLQKIVAEILMVIDKGGDPSAPLQQLQEVGEKMDQRCNEFINQ